MADETTTNTSETAPNQGGEPSVTNEKPTPPRMSPAGQAALTALMDREKAVRQQEASLKQQAAEIERKRQELAGPPEDPDPLQLTQKSVEELRAELQALKERDQQYRQQTVVEEEKARIREALKSAEEYQGVNATNAHDTVFEQMLSHYNQTGEWISEAEAAKRVEEGLRGLYENLHKVYGSSGQPSPQSHASAAEAFNTLHAKMTSEAGSQTNRVLSPQEATAKAAKLLRFKTK